LRGPTIVQSLKLLSDPAGADQVKAKVTALRTCLIGARHVAELDDLGEIFANPRSNRFGRLDIMVNNAGSQSDSPLLETTEELYDRIMAVNPLKSAVFGTAILPAKQMISQGSGGRNH